MRLGQREVFFVLTTLKELMKGADIENDFSCFDAAHPPKCRKRRNALLFKRDIAIEHQLLRLLVFS